MTKKEISININQNQLLAAQMLAAGKTGKAVAEQLGVTEETISRWKQNPDFKIYLDELIIGVHESARLKLQSLVEKAVNAIESAIDDPNLTPKEKITFGFKIFETCNVYNYSLSREVEKLRDPLNSLF